MQRTSTANAAAELERFSSPFSAAYWRQAAAALRSPRMLVIAAMIIALRVVMQFVSIPVFPPSLNVTFGFFFNALGAMIYGPIVAPITGLCSDIIGFFLTGGGSFFPGYTLNAMLSSLIFALCLWRANISLWRAALGKGMINLLVNIALGSLWSAVLYSKGFLFYLGRGALKNLVLLPFEILFLTAFLYALSPALVRLKLICPQKRQEISRHDRIVLVIVCIAAALLALVAGILLYRWLK